MKGIRLDEMLKAGLEAIRPVFRDSVPEHFEGDEVIRFSIPDTTSSLSGDDKVLGKTKHIQIDLYTKRKRYDLEEMIENFLDENYLRVSNEKEIFEEGRKRKIYFINYEE